MKKLVSFLSVTALAATVAGFAPAGGWAAVPVPMHMTFYLDAVDLEQSVALGNGTIFVEGLLDEPVEAMELFRLTPLNPNGEQTSHGIKTLTKVSGTGEEAVVSTITIRFDVPVTQMPPEPPVFLPIPDLAYPMGIQLGHGEGRFAILAATGYFAGLNGQGAAVVDLVLALAADGGVPKVVLIADYTGQALIAP